ncbi:uncharacterized protein LOC142584952 isoform X3 [Dermacentor variabilis]|uniref:uncharacterized protein LOC142584952 isoform X3 n=1 Tax=Dermacentor variabilis TaxID=34621 RepID=UPI003F5C2BB3
MVLSPTTVKQARTLADGDESGEMRAAAPPYGRMGTSSTASPRTRPQFPGALKTSPVSRASYTIIRRPPTTHDEVRAMEPTEECSNRGDHKPRAGYGSSTIGHPADGRGTAFLTLRGRPRSVRGRLIRPVHSVPERRDHKSGEQDYEEEDWDLECPLSNGSTAAGGNDHKIATKKEPKRVHWEEGDRLTTVFPVPRRSNHRKMVSEKCQKAGDWNQGWPSPHYSTGKRHNDEATVFTEEQEKQEGQSNLGNSECPVVEEREDGTIAPCYEEEDWEPECRQVTESTAVTQKDQSTVSAEEVWHEERQCEQKAPLTIEFPAAKQCDRETVAIEGDWRPEAPSKSLSATATQTVQETSGSDEEDGYWDDDEDDLSADEPTVIIRIEPRSEEEQTTRESLEQRTPVATTSTASTQLDLAAMPAGAYEYSRQEWLSSTEPATLTGSDDPRTALAHIDGRGQYWGEQGFAAESPAVKQGVPDVVTAVEQHRDEYSEAGATTSTVQMLPVLSYLCFPVVTYEPFTVQVPSATEFPPDSLPYDGSTGTQEQPKEDHWEEVRPSATYFSSASDGCNSVTTNEEDWWKEESLEQLGQWTTDFTLASQLYHESLLPEDREKEEDWEKQCQPLSDFTLSSQAFSEAMVPEVQDDDWKQDFPVQSLAATPTPFGVMTSEWQGGDEDWEPECTSILAIGSSLPTDGYYGGAATDVPTSEEEDWHQGRPLATEFTATAEKFDGTATSVEFTEEENWETEIVPGQPGYVPQVSTFFQRMRHRSHRQRRRLYREQAAQYRLQEEDRAKTGGDDASMQAGGHRPSDGSGPSSEGLPPPPPPSASQACRDELQGRGSQMNPAAANRMERRTMADVVRSPAPPPAQSSSSSSQPPTTVQASYRAAAGDQAGVQVAPEDGTWQVATFLQAAWTVVAGSDGCLFYESKRNTGGPLA